MFYTFHLLDIDSRLQSTKKKLEKMSDFSGAEGLVLKFSTCKRRIYKSKSHRNLRKYRWYTGLMKSGI